MRRRLMSTVVPSLSTLVILAAGVYGGYRAWQDYKSPFKLIEDQGAYYLFEKETDNKIRITENFQCGSLEYRVGGILKESKERLYNALENTRKKLE